MLEEGISKEDQEKLLFHASVAWIIDNDCKIQLTDGKEAAIFW